MNNRPKTEHQEIFPRSEATSPKEVYALRESLKYPPSCNYSAEFLLSSEYLEVETLMQQALTELASAEYQGDPVPPSVKIIMDDVFPSEWDREIEDYRTGNYLAYSAFISEQLKAFVADPCSFDETNLTNLMHLTDVIRILQTYNNRNKETALATRSIKDSSSYLRDVLTEQRYPALFSVANAHVESLAPVTAEMRYSSDKLNVPFNEALTNAKILTDQTLRNPWDLDASIKSTSSVIRKMATDKRMISAIATNLPPLPDEFEATEINSRLAELLKTDRGMHDQNDIEFLETMIELVLTQGSANVLMETIETLSQETYDLARCRLFIGHPRTYDETIVRSRTYVGKVELQEVVTRPKIRSRIGYNAAQSDILGRYELTARNQPIPFAGMRQITKKHIATTHEKGLLPTLRVRAIAPLELAGKITPIEWQIMHATDQDIELNNCIYHQGDINPYGKALFSEGHLALYIRKMIQHNADALKVLDRVIKT